MSAQFPLHAHLRRPDVPCDDGHCVRRHQFAIPLGGIVTPLLIAAITNRASFGAALLVIPLGLLVGLLMIVLLLERDAPHLLAEAGYERTVIKSVKLITASSSSRCSSWAWAARSSARRRVPIGLTAAQIGLLIAAQNVIPLLGDDLRPRADTHPKPKILLIGSSILGISFLAFYLVPSFWVNLAIMLFCGVGLGTYEGVLDAMLLDLHESGPPSSSTSTTSS